MCNITTGLALCLVLLSQVFASGQFNLYLSQFNNDRGVLSNDTCCSGTKTNGICENSCNTRFKICLTHYQVDINPETDCTFGEFLSDRYTNNSLIFENIPDWKTHYTPIQIPVTVAWNGDFSIVITFMDESSPGSRIISQYLHSSELRPGALSNQIFNSSTGASLALSWGYECDADFYGPKCKQNCIGRDDELGHFECGVNGERVCLQGWKGEYCSEAICLEGCNGTCERPNECRCSQGWEGRLCDQCKTYPYCAHGYCADTPWSCLCYEGWGGEFCNQDLIYCTRNSPCRNGATCLNTGSGYYTCVCPDGYSGDNCEQLDNVCAINTCQNGGTCMNIGENYQCQCMDGFSGRNCELQGQQPCSNSNANPCLNGGICQSIGTSGYRCECPTGYKGIYCHLPVDDCVSSPCENGGTCHDELNGYRCECPTGFSGRTCSEDRNECLSNPCQNGARCEDRAGEFHCRCQPGFVGSLCEQDVDDCIAEVCANGATCIDKVNDFNCICRPGYTGRFCSDEINECASNPCRNGATCVDHIANFECVCSPEFEGRTCQYLFGLAPTTQSKSTPATTHKPIINSPAASTENTDGPPAVQFTATQLALIVIFGSAVPMILLFVFVALLLYRRCKKSRNEPSVEFQQNEINNRSCSTSTTSSKLDDYPAPDKLLPEPVATHQIPLDYKNDASSFQAKVVNKDLIKDITKPAVDRAKKSNNTAMVSHYQIPISQTHTPQGALQYYQSCNDSLYNPSLSRNQSFQHHSRASVAANSAIPSVSGRLSSYTSDERELYPQSHYNATDV